MRRFDALAVVALTMLGCFALPALTHEHEAEHEEMSAEQQMMMEKWQEYMKPGEPHERMAEAVGTWDYTARMWEQPGMPPQESPGKARFETIMGGRYLVQHASGTFMGEPFEGMGITGYDNMKDKYQSMWIDSMGTGVLLSEGTCDGNVCTYYGEVPDVMQGEYKRIKSVSREIGDDRMVFEMYDRGPDGKEWKNFEIEYHRRK